MNEVQRSPEHLQGWHPCRAPAPQLSTTQDRERRSSWESHQGAGVLSCYAGPDGKAAAMLGLRTLHLMAGGKGTAGFCHVAYQH